MLYLGWGLVGLGIILIVLSIYKMVEIKRNSMDDYNDYVVDSFHPKERIMKNLNKFN